MCLALAGRPRELKANKNTFMRACMRVLCVHAAALLGTRLNRYASSNSFFVFVMCRTIKLATPKKTDYIFI